MVSRVRTIVGKSDSPIVSSIVQNYRPMRLRCDSFSSALSQNDAQRIKINKTNCNRIIILNRSIGVVNC